MISTNKITEIFCSIDDFCLEFHSPKQKNRLRQDVKTAKGLKGSEQTIRIRVFEVLTNSLKRGSFLKLKLLPAPSRAKASVLKTFVSFR